MSRRRAGWIHLVTTRSERDQSPGHEPGEGGHDEKEMRERGFIKRKHRKHSVPLEGGHSQASIGEQENMMREGGHSQSSNGINPYREKNDEGGHNQSSTGKHMHYGHHGRYNDSIDF